MLSTIFTSCPALSQAPHRKFSLATTPWISIESGVTTCRPYPQNVPTCPGQVVLVKPVVPEKELPPMKLAPIETLPSATIFTPTSRLPFASTSNRETDPPLVISAPAIRRRAVPELLKLVLAIATSPPALIMAPAVRLRSKVELLMFPKPPASNSAPAPLTEFETP